MLSNLLKMKKSYFSKILTALFVISIILPVSFSMQSCRHDKYNKLKYNKPRNGGRKIKSNGSMGRDRYKKRYKHKID